MWPSTYRAARAANLSEEEIDALCLEGVALAFVRYNPNRGASIGTAVTWSIRASVGSAVRSARKESIHFEHYPTTIDNRNERHFNFPGDYELSTTEGIVAEKCSPTSECAEEITHYLSQANLSTQERYVLILRFGLAKRSPLSTTATGYAMGLSPERIRQLQEKAIRKIRKAIGLDIDWRVRSRSRILVYLSSLSNSTSEKTSDSQTSAQTAASKAEICKRAQVTRWQFREIVRRLLREGLVIRERVQLSRERWGIVFRLREAKTIP
jgi:RNA polymerase sigma factor (sigma-70 family)